MPTQHSTQATQQEYNLNGVRCAEFSHQGQPWRLASCTPNWRAELPLLETTPTPETLAALAAKGIWLNLAKEAAPLALMCCGQGTVWPHMGRELYDRLPAARAAMDHIASIASWDVLSLLDEDDIEVIGQTRWQQPYLFLLEYAQWSYFSSLGFTPRVMAGHSLGEMIALCFAGAYSPETAWAMIDTRARHTADIEAASTRSSGMMAVHADEQRIHELLTEYPELYISNFNTPTQVILSGPRDMLSAARKTLRKQRIPAMMLNVSVAFHNPAMRVLHNTAIQRLRMQEMRPEGPCLPVMSNTTADIYPFSREGVCQYISVLDENSVRWVECVRTMWEKFGIRHFLETGPQDTLCGLVSATQPHAICIPSVKKGRELDGLREAVAQLYTLGHIPHAVLKRASIDTTIQQEENTPPPPPTSVHTATPAGLDEDFLAEVLDQIATTLDIPRANVRPEHDLRQDLGLRSSRFPLLLQDVEQRFGITIRFEAMQHVLTVGDFAYALYCIQNPQASHPKEQGVHRKTHILPIRRWRLHKSQDHWQAIPAAINPLTQSINIHSGDHVIIIPTLPLLPQLFTSLAALGCTLSFILPPNTQSEDAARFCAVLKQLGATVHSTICDAAKDTCFKLCAEKLVQQAGKAQGLILFASTTALHTPSPEGYIPLDMVEYISTLYAPQWRAILAADPQHKTEFPALAHTLRTLASSSLPTRCIILPLAEELRPGRLLRSQYAGDMLVRELLYGSNDCLLWSRQTLPNLPLAIQNNPTEPLFMPASTQAERTGQYAHTKHWPLVWPQAPQKGHTGPQLFEGECHFSTYADAALEKHAVNNTLQHILLARMLEAMLEASCQHLPWLSPTGIADLRWTTLLDLPQGLTQECAVYVSTSVWFRPDGHFSRLCPVQLRARELHTNGRRTTTFTDVASASVLLAPQPRLVPSLWSTPASATDHVWIQDKGIIASQSSYSAYVFPLQILESALELTQQALQASMPTQYKNMHLAGIGFIYFSSQRPVTRLEVRRTFLNEDRVQFDLQATAADGTILLTCNTIEYVLHTAHNETNI